MLGSVQWLEWVLCGFRVEHVVSSKATTWPLVCDELTAVHVLQPDEVFLPPKQLPSAAQTPSKVGQCDIDASAP